MAKEKRNLFFKLIALAIFVLALASTGYAVAYTGPGALTAGSGTGLMSVSGSNIGIGVASPTLPLQVKDNAVAYPYQAAQFTTTDWTTTVGSTFQIGHGASTGNTFSELRALTSGYNAWGNLIMQVGGGRVGIGTSTPAYTLDVNGNVRATAFVGAISGSMAADNVSSGSFGSLQGGGSYTFPASLGVGTTTAPSVRLDVFGTGAFGSMTTSRGGYSNGLSVQNLAATPTSLFLWENGVGSGHIGFRVNDSNLYIVNAFADGLITNPAAIALSSAGYVGIGTNAPGFPLDVQGSYVAGIRYTRNVEDARIQVASPSQTWGFASGWNNAPGNLNIIQEGVASRLTIASSTGNVGLGTNTPAYRLDVLGDINFTGTLRQNGSPVSGGSSQWTTSSTSIYYNTGNVGIGTAAPSQKLEVSGSVKATAFIGTLSGSVAADNVSSGSFGSLQGGGSYTFPASLGVGTTTTPGNKLSIVTPFAADDVIPALGVNGGKLGLFNTSATGPYGLLAGVLGSGSAYLQVQRVDGTATAYNLLLQPTAGNVGIGTTAPGAPLNIAPGSAQFPRALMIDQSTHAISRRAAIDVGSNAGSLTSGWEIGQDSNGNGTKDFYIYDINSSAHRLNISTTGNVGIGTTAPAQKLDVNGVVALYGKVAFEGADTWLRINQSGTFTSGTYFGSNIIRTDGQLQVGGNGSSFLVTSTGNVTASGYVADLTGRLARNLLDTNTWTVSSGSIGGWNANDSVAGESQRLWNNDPFGNPALLWRGVTNAANDASGGWNYYNIPVTDTKAYRSSVWFRMNANAGGNLYLGLDTGNTNNLDGTTNTNPYFHAVTWANFIPGRWYLFVGYIHASNDPSTTSYSAIYDGVTGQKYLLGTDYKNKVGITTQTQRVYSYYNTVAGTTVDMWGPRFEQMDGSEPSIGALLGGTVSSAAMNVNPSCAGAVTIDWSKGSTQHCTMTGNVTFTFTTPGFSGASFRLVLLQDATGGRTVTWPASVRWGSMGVPSLTATPSKTDYVGFIYNGVSGTYDGIAFNSNF